MANARKAIAGYLDSLAAHGDPIPPSIEGAVVDLPEDADAEALPVPAAHRTELDRRLRDLELYPDAGSPWDEVRRRLERR